jgi:hypothetical protein
MLSRICPTFAKELAVRRRDSGIFDGSKILTFSSISNLISEQFLPTIMPIPLSGFLGMPEDWLRAWEWI